MLDSLAEMEVTMKMLKQEDDTQIPVDHHYAQLKTEIGVIPKDSATFELLQRFVSDSSQIRTGYLNLSQTIFNDPKFQCY